MAPCTHPGMKGLFYLKAKNGLIIRRIRTPGIVPRAYRTRKSFGSDQISCITHRRVGYGYEVIMYRTELTEVSGRVWMLYRTHKSVGYGYNTLFHGRAERTKVSGWVLISYRTHRSVAYGWVPGMNVLQNPHSVVYNIRVNSPCTHPTEHNFPCLSYAIVLLGYGSSSPFDTRCYEQPMFRLASITMTRETVLLRNFRSENPILSCLRIQHTY